MDTSFKGTRRIRVDWEPVLGQATPESSLVEPRELIGLPVPLLQRSFRLSDVCTVRVTGSIGEDPREHAFELPRKPIYYIGRELTLAEAATVELAGLRGAFEEALSQGATCILPRWPGDIPAFAVRPGQDCRIVTLDSTDRIVSITRPLTPAGTLAT